MASHLTLEEREVIAHMRRAGKMQTQIAARLGRRSCAFWASRVAKCPGLFACCAPNTAPRTAIEY